MIAFAGKKTLSDVTLKVLGRFEIAWTLSIAVSGLALSLYFVERRSHRKTRERLTRENRLLEEQLDRNRTSSGLTPEGLTRSED